MFWMPANSHECPDYSTQVGRLKKERVWAAECLGNTGWNGFQIKTIITLRPSRGIILFHRIKFPVEVIKCGALVFGNKVAKAFVLFRYRRGNSSGLSYGFLLAPSHIEDICQRKLGAGSSPRDAKETAY